MCHFLVFCLAFSTNLMTRLKICRKLSSLLSARLRTSTSLDDSILLTIAYVSYHRVRVEDEAHLDVDGVEDGIPT